MDPQLANAGNFWSIFPRLVHCSGFGASNYGDSFSKLLAALGGDKIGSVFMYIVSYRNGAPFDT